MVTWRAPTISFSAASHASTSFWSGTTISALAPSSATFAASDASAAAQLSPGATCQAARAILPATTASTNDSPKV